MSKRPTNATCRVTASRTGGVYSRPLVCAAAPVTAGLLLVIGVGICAVTPQRAAEGAEAAMNEQIEDVTIALRRLQELRRIDVIEPEGNVFEHHKPGLVLTYDLKLRDGLTIHGIEQPTSVKAVDDAGKDLSRIEPGFRGERDYVSLKQEWDQPPSGLEFRLLPSSRGATTFTLNTTLRIAAHGGTEVVTVEPSKQWINMDASLFSVDGLEVRMQQGGFDGRSAEVSLRPGTVRDAIDKVYLIDGGQETESSSAMWSDQFATFSFNHPFREGQQVRFLVRTDVRSIPVTIELEDFDLP